MKDVGAIATIFDAAGRVLLVHQTYKGSKWAWPGGIVEEDESPWIAAVREVSGNRTGRRGRATGQHLPHRRPECGRLSILVPRDRGELRVDGGEISEAAFFDPAHLPVPMTEPGRQRVADALANCDQPILREFATLEIIEA